ncbi:MAG: hypothetical protein ACR2NA_08910 [Solirubrobacterales bacterium]
MSAIADRLRAERELLDFRTGYWRGRARLKALCDQEAPVVAGPFVSEIGFESLYWIPLLTWLRDHQGLDPERVTAVSRGGPSAWYAGVASRYVDVFDHMSPEELKQGTARRLADTRNEKQFGVAEVDREILDRMSSVLPEGARLLHPSIMYRLFWAFWSGRRPARRVHDMVSFTPFGAQRDGLSPEAREAIDALPEDYVAVKGYFSSCFPDTAANRRFMAELLATLGRDTEIVSLSTGIDLDEHGELNGGARVHSLEHVMTPATNLAVQSAVLGRARALYTTYGGFAHLGPFLGTRTVCFYSDEVFNATHLDMMSRATRDLRRTGSDVGFVLFDVRDADLVGLTQQPTPAWPRR